MSLIVIAVCAGVAASLGLFAARRRGKGGATTDEEGAKDASDEPKPKAGDKAKGDTPKPAAKVAAAGKGKKAPAAAASPFAGLPLELNDVVSAEREERWLAGALITREGGRVHSALFLAPEGSKIFAVAVFPPPRKDLYWLEPAEVEAPEEPPATLEIRGVSLSRRARIPVSLERHGQGAPQVGETGIWAAYEGSGRDVGIVITSGGKVHAWSGVRFEEGEYDRLGGGGASD